MADLISRQIAPLDIAGLLNKPLHRLILWGDSRARQAYNDATNRNRSARNHLPWANALSGQRLSIAGNYGVSGYRTDQVLASVATVAASGAGLVKAMAGINDILQDYPTAATSGATAFANIKTAVDAFYDAGMTTILTLDPGSALCSAAQIGQLIELNERLREYAEVKGRVHLFDLPSIVWNPVNSTSAIAFKAGAYADETHEAAGGAYLGGKALAALIQQLVPPRPSMLGNIIETPSGNSKVHLLDNPLFVTTTGGTLNTGMSGTMPASWEAVRGSGTPTANISTGAAGGGAPGNELILACTFNAAGEQIRVQQTANIANWSAGDIVQGLAEISVDAGGALGQPYLYMQVNGDTGALVSMDLANSGNEQASAEAYTVQLATEKLTVPAYGAKTNLTLQIRLVASGAGNATVRIRRPTIRKRYA